jgi:phosphatidylglycerophosphate synthase
MWAAHLLTLSRLPIAFGLVGAYGDPVWSVALVALAALTDMLDGTVARAMQRRGHTRPDIGGWLDPLVDKIFVAVAVATIWIHTHDLALIGLIAARELVLVPLVIAYLVRGRPASHLHADAIGKAATIAQLVAIGVAVAVPAHALPFAAVAAVLGVAAVVHYVMRESRASIA